MDLSKTGNNKNYDFFFTFSSVMGILFFMGIYIPFQRTLWVSILIAGIITFFLLSLIDKLQCRPLSWKISSFFIPVIALLYCAFALYAFFSFCSDRVFPKNSILFFPLCFLPLLFYGASKGIFVVERSAKLISPIIFFLILLTFASSLEKMWTQHENNFYELSDLFQIEKTSFLIQTMVICVLFLLQGFILQWIIFTETGNYRSAASVKKALFFTAILLSILYFLAELLLGPYAFEALPYPIYDMLSLSGSAEYLDRTELMMLIVFLFCEGIRGITFLCSFKVMFKFSKFFDK